MYFITLSRKMGPMDLRSPDGWQTNWSILSIDTEAIENTAREVGILENVKEIDEKVPSLFQRLFSQQPEVHLDRLQSVIYKLACRGNAVFLGRGSHILLRSFKCALHLRVIASLEKRIENLGKREWPREVAIKAIHKSDHERGAFIKFAFGVDWDNPLERRTA